MEYGNSCLVGMLDKITKTTNNSSSSYFASQLVIIIMIIIIRRLIIKVKVNNQNWLTVRTSWYYVSIPFVETVTVIIFFCVSVLRVECGRSMRRVGRWWCILLVLLLNDIRCIMCVKCMHSPVVLFPLSFSCQLLISQQNLAAWQVRIVIWQMIILHVIGCLCIIRDTQLVTVIIIEYQSWTSVVWMCVLHDRNVFWPV